MSDKRRKTRRTTKSQPHLVREPPGYRCLKKRGRKIDAHVEWVAQVLEQGRAIPRKQRHSAKRIFDRLRDEQGYTGGYTLVKELVAGMKAMKAEVFVPLSHRRGEAQVDFGHALVNVDGSLKKCPYFVMSLPYHDSRGGTPYKNFCCAGPGFPVQRAYGYLWSLFQQKLILLGVSPSYDESARIRRKSFDDKSRMGVSINSIRNKEISTWIFRMNRVFKKENMPGMIYPPPRSCLLYSQFTKRDSRPGYRHSPVHG